MTDTPEPNFDVPEPEPDEAAETLKWEIWARVQLDKDRDPAALQAEMVQQGWPAEAAEDLLSRVRARQELDYSEAAAEREEWRMAGRRHRRNMIIGGVYFMTGLVVTVRGWREPESVGWLPRLIAAAALAFGLLRFAWGLLGYLRPMSIRLEGRHVPGRRIGSYTPGAPRSRYSRFT